jgi:hypothetical protein
VELLIEQKMAAKAYTWVNLFATTELADYTRLIDARVSDPERNGRSINGDGVRCWCKGSDSNWSGKRTSGMCRCWWSRKRHSSEPQKS